MVHVLESGHQERNTAQKTMQKTHERKHRISTHSLPQLRRYGLTAVRTDGVNRIFSVLQTDFGVLNNDGIFVGLRVWSVLRLRGGGFGGHEERNFNGEASNGLL